MHPHLFEPRSFHRLATVALAAGSVFGCSTTSPAAGDAADTVECVPDSGTFPVDTYTANMSKPGDQGMLTFTIVNADPAPPGRGTNTFTIKVTKSDGTPFTGTITAPNNDKNGIWMPRHAHGSSVADTIQPVDSSPGTYTLSSVDLFMVGYWQIRISAHDSSQAMAVIDSAAFYFCI